MALQQEDPHKVLEGRVQKDYRTPGLSLSTSRESRIEFMGGTTPEEPLLLILPKDIETSSLGGDLGGFTETQETCAPIKESSVGSGNLVSGLHTCLSLMQMPQGGTIDNTTATPMYTDSPRIGEVAEHGIKGKRDRTMLHTEEEAVPNEARPHQNPTQRASRENAMGVGRGWLRQGLQLMGIRLSSPQ